VFASGALLLLGGCGQSVDNPPSASETERTTTTETPEAGTETNLSTDTTFPQEVVQFAEANGASLEEAAALLAGQIAQNEGLARLHGLVGEGMIVGAAFGEYPRSDELTVFVVDEEAVAIVEAHLAESGLDPARTFVEVAPEEPPYDPWNWLEGERYAGYEWLESPGPHLFGPWELVESNGVVPEVAVLGGFWDRWSLEQCSSWVGRVLTSAEGSVTLTVDRADLECREATETVDRLLVGVIVESGGEFEVLANGEDRMVWEASTGDTLVWEQPEEFAEFAVPVYPENRAEIYETWARSPAPEMEGIWYLQEVGGEEPAAPVSINVGVSTIGFQGQCNEMDGMFAISTDHQLGMHLGRTQMQCMGPTGEVEAQMDEVLWGNDELLRVSIEDYTMTWANQAGPQMIWSR
jgi:hypothetical protein